MQNNAKLYTQTINEEGILKLGHPDLYKISKAVNDDQLKQVSEYKSTLIEFANTFGPAAGLAAPQIGMPLRLFIFRDRMQDEFSIAINPEYEPIDDICESGLENCLSLPEFAGEVDRYKEIKVNYLDENLNIIEKTFSGFLSRVFQHEHDHLNGILYINRLTNIKNFGYKETVKEYLL